MNPGSGRAGRRRYDGILIKSLEITTFTNQIRPDPVVVYNKSHSGSRLLALLLRRAGVFLGSHLNDSLDSWDLLPVVRYLVTRYYPDYGDVLEGRDPSVGPMVQAALERHLEAAPARPDAPWGWKLCETAFVVPVVAALWPGSRFVHLIRDGRDVAFSDHTGPTDAFWRKVFFGRDDVASWRGMDLDGPTYRRHPHLFNAQHWVSSVRTGRHYGTLLPGRYLEVRYEDLCFRFDETCGQLEQFLGLSLGPETRDAVRCTIRSASVGKFRSKDPGQVREVLEIVGPLQAELGYPVAER